VIWRYTLVNFGKWWKQRRCWGYRAARNLEMLSTLPRVVGIYRRPSGNLLPTLF